MSQIPAFTREWLTGYVLLATPELNIPGEKTKARSIAAYMIHSLESGVYQGNTVMARVAKELIPLCLSNPNTNHFPCSAFADEMQLDLDRVSLGTMALVKHFICNMFDRPDKIPLELTRKVFDSFFASFCHGRCQFWWERCLSNSSGQMLKKLLVDKQQLAAGVWAKRNEGCLNDIFGCGYIDEYFMVADHGARERMILLGMARNRPSLSVKLIRLHFASEYPGIFDDIPYRKMPSEWVIAAFLSSSTKLEGISYKLLTTVESIVGGGRFPLPIVKRMSKQAVKLEVSMRPFSIGMLSMIFETWSSFPCRRIFEEMTITKSAILEAVASALGNKHIADIVIDLI